MAATFSGASVLPYSVDPLHHKVYFILGQERKGRWTGASEWGDFGGATKQESVEETAAREFFEETAGTIYLHEEDGGGLRAPDRLVHMLEQQQFTLRVDFDGYCTFLKKVPWQPQKFTLFRQVVHGLVRLRNAPLTTPPKFLWTHPAIQDVTESPVHINDAFLEKQKLAYFSIPTLQRACAQPSRQLLHHSRLRKSFAYRLSCILSSFTAAT